MAAFDRLPPALRHWLHGAALPWSPASARRAWGKALLEARGCEAAALARLDRIEAERLSRDAAMPSIPRDGKRDRAGAGHPGNRAARPCHITAGPGSRRD